MASSETLMLPDITVVLTLISSKKKFSFSNVTLFATPP